MANRRMIDTRIVGSPRFLGMSKAAQAFYFHLIANSDDEGVTVASVLLRTTNTRKTALQELLNNGFVTMLEQDQSIVYTSEWHSFNSVDARYGQPSYYHKTLQEHFPNMRFVEFKRFSGNNPTSDTSEREESRVEESKVKDSIIKDSKVEDSISNTNMYYIDNKDEDEYGELPFS